ncbi:hypothetical protein MLD38_016849 [Melastoma candidum]|uniref:Uncharacterized protein n=1 Tax=Melastoma candidum TaxID=119954 RepID=A0ACB9QNR4_9MYRT|nr:hypothetical protein MLD38_016849 [Melastoma candidum]
MEGLIPMVFKAIRRSKERSHYEYLSSSTARTYDISDFYLPGGQAQPRSHFHPTPPPRNGMVDQGPFAGRGARHVRSYSSAAELSYGKRFDPEDERGMPRKQQQLVRFRSTRMLSCLTGA